MMRRTRAVVVALIGIGAVWALRSERNHGERTVDDALAQHVLRDLANERFIDWETTSGYQELRGAAVEFHNAQEQPATIELRHRKALIYGEDWRIVIDLGQVHEIVCVREFHHWPEPGFVVLHVDFRNGPEDEHGHADAVLRADFEEAHEQEFRRLCDRNGLRKIGDFGVR